MAELIQKKTVLFLCTHNSARSQMAEGILKALYGNVYDVFSAGTEPTQVDAYAIKALHEIGIDISGYHSKGVDEFVNKKFNYIVTLCDHAKEACPYLPGGEIIIHKGFFDPASVEGSEVDKLNAFRRTRNEIKAWVTEEFTPNGRD